MDSAPTAVALPLAPLPGQPSARALVTAVFFAFSISLGLWAGAIPALMRQTGLDVEGLGLALTLHTAVYIAAMAAGGQLARFVAPRRLMRAALLAIVPCACWLFSTRTAAELTAALAALGAGSGLLDLAMNAEGTALERGLGRRVLLGMHAAASAAFAVAALGGSLIATAAGPRWCALPVLAVLLPVLLALQRAGLGAKGAQGAPLPPMASMAAVDVQDDQEAVPGSRLSAWAERQPALREQQPALAERQPALPEQQPALERVGGSHGVLRIGVVLGLAISSEVAAQMWSARFLARQAADLAAFAGAGAAFFTGFQAAVRLFGDALRRRLGDVRTILASLVAAALGFGVVAASALFSQSLAGFALVGIGTACVVPCCFALIAQRAGQRAPAALGMASLVAGAVRIPAPLLLGAAAARWSDGWAFAGVGGALALAFVLARNEARPSA